MTFASASATIKYAAPSTSGRYRASLMSACIANGVAAGIHHITVAYELRTLFSRPSIRERCDRNAFGRARTGRMTESRGQPSDASAAAPQKPIRQHTRGQANCDGGDERTEDTRLGPG